MASLSQEEGQKTTTNTTSHDATPNVYETDQSLHMYLGLHYPESGGNEGIDPILKHVNAPNHALRFPQRVAALLVDLLRKQEQQENQQSSSTSTGNTTQTLTSTISRNTRRRIKKALDIGCAVGGSSFELAKTFDHVDAFDYSTKFIDVAKKMQQQQGNKNNKKKIRFKIPIEAELFEEVEACHDDGVDATILSKVNFFVGDACNLKDMQAEGKIDNSSSYDGVIMSNLLCRLSDPMACLTSLNGIVKKDGGIVVIVTPYSWLEEFTSKEKWLGGYYYVAENADEESSSSSSPSTTENNEKPLPTKKKVYSKDVLTQVMEGHGFVKIHEEQMPLIIREHQRKYQYIISEATGWLRV